MQYLAYSLIFILANILINILTLFIFIICFKKWIQKSPYIRNFLFSFFKFQNYTNLMQDTYSKLSNQKIIIQKILSQSLGQNHKEVLDDLETSYQQLENIMHQHLQNQKNLEKKLFGHSLK